jgi:hypothetical protein
MKFGKTIGDFTPIVCDNFSKFNIFLFNVKIASDKYIHNGKHYVLVDCTSFIDTLTKINEFARTKFSNFSSCFDSHNNTIVVKLPFRYNRYQINWKGLSTSGDILDQAYCNIDIQLVGITTSLSKCFCSFKCISFGVLQT